MFVLKIWGDARENLVETMNGVTKLKGQRSTLLKIMFVRSLTCPCIGQLKKRAQMLTPMRRSFRISFMVETAPCKCHSCGERTKIIPEFLCTAIPALSVYGVYGFKAKPT